MLGLDLLVNTANIFYLFSYSVRDILWLRVLSISGALLLLPYYYLQDAPLWTPIGWNVFFTLINLYWVTTLMLERRPVPFNETERRLYDTALRNFSERDAYKFLQMGEYVSAQAGTTVLTQGKTVDSLWLVVSGEFDVSVDGTRKDTLGENRFLGGTAFLSDDPGFAAPVTVTARQPSQVLRWDLEELRSKLQLQPALALAIEASIGLEISRFLETARLQHA